MMNADDIILGDYMSTEADTIRILDPCPSSAPLVIVGRVELISVGCSKNRGHEGDHEWTLSWKDESA